MADRLKAGAKLIVVDPRRTTTAEKADLFLQIKPGTDLALLNGLLHLLVQNGAIDREFIAEHTQGWDGMPAFLDDYPPDRVAEITGLAEADLRTAAAMIAEAGEWMTCWTMGLNQSTHGTWNTNAICNLHLATGAICRPGSGPMSLTGQPNAMGGREMGYMGPGLPGQRAVLSADDRAFVEAQWDLEPGTIRSDVGPGTIAMFEQMAAGAIKACWIVCTNPVATVANRDTVIDALRAAELVITQDAYRDTATNAYADIVLPGHAVGRIRCGDGEFGTQPDPIAAVGAADRRRPAGLGTDLRGRRAVGLRCTVRLQVGRGDLRRDPPVPQPAHRIRPARRELSTVAGNPAAVARSAGGRPGGRHRPPPDALPQRRGQPGSVRRCRRAPAPAGVPDADAQGGVPRPPAHGARRTAR